MKKETALRKLRECFDVLVKQYKIDIQETKDFKDLINDVENAE